MAAIKKRIGISISKDLEEMLELLAKRDQVALATKAEELLEFFLEVEEDRVLADIAAERDTPNARFISHADIWK